MTGGWVETTTVTRTIRNTIVKYCAIQTRDKPPMQMFLGVRHAFLRHEG